MKKIKKIALLSTMIIGLGVCANAATLGISISLGTSVPITVTTLPSHNHTHVVTAPQHKPQLPQMHKNNKKPDNHKKQVNIKQPNHRR
ncbi:hypothetical protein Dip510_001526 [Elusimicrobium posterum]|uniref:hypothetical protein n=1 Tax=Elusimicrobium posterum TaxID=3116653 RepID=UPI003C72F834